MCGRFTLTVTLDELLQRYLLENNYPLFHSPRYNVAPGQMVPAIIHDGKSNRIGPLLWGLVPNWATDAKIGYKMINARSETVLQKPAFKNLIVRKRAIIPADSFYEWMTIDGRKQPMRIMLHSKDVFSMAALYDSWYSPDGRKISTFTILTTAPNRLMEPIHSRMPVILRQEDEQRWLNRGSADLLDLLSMLRPYAEEEMTAYPVPPKVGHVKNDTADCIEEDTTFR